MLTLDGEVVVFPNSFVLSKQISNHSTNPINRVHVSVGIAYKESIAEARRVLMKLVENDDRIVKDPPPDVVVGSLADSSVNLQLRFWIKDEAVERIIVYEYNEKAKIALDAAKIEIPFPHMQLFVEKSAGLEALSPPSAKVA
jgi:small conductance mechanosensitive channel